MMKLEKSQAAKVVGTRSASFGRALRAVVVLAFVAPAFAKDKPVVVNGKLSGEINHQATEPTPDSKPATEPAASTPSQPDTTKRAEVHWGYVKLKAQPAKAINRPVRAAAPWKYQPTNKRYQPRPQKDYQPKQDWSYTPKRSFDYQPKTNWSFTPRVWNRY